jgi:hypothetical protein
VHYAGNLQIAASFFLVLGLPLALVLSVFTVIAGIAPSVAGHHHGEKRRESLTDETPSNDKSRRRAWVSSPATPFIVAALLACLCIGATMQILAQFFGVLGLTVNATPTALTSQGTQKNATLANYVAGSWAIGDGLSIYATTAWASALACTAVATTVFRTPRWSKLL